MKALATLVGPYGIKLIDREILKGITQSIGLLKVIFSLKKKDPYSICVIIVLLISFFSLKKKGILITQ